MPTTTFHFVQLPDSLRDLGVQAARAVCPHAVIRPAATVADALRHPAHGRELLLVGGVDEKEGGLASQAIDDGELPRWAVVHLGSNPSDMFDTVPPEDWNVRQLGRILRSSLMQHELLRENLRLRGDLKTIARRVTHDQRTPLGCILTICEAFKDPAHPGMTTEDAVEAVRNSADELSKLTDQVSLLLKATLDPVPPLPFLMGPVLTQVLSELPPDLERRAQRIRQPAEWPTAVGVPEWVATIWGELIHNALRHGHHSGNVQLGWTPAEHEIRFWISSPGTVSAHLRPRLMRSFHLLHKQAGVGLGLSLVERLVALQCGRSDYTATENNRSVFAFTLPAPASADRPAAEKIARPARNLATS